MKKLIIALSLLLAAPAFASGTGPKHETFKLGTLIDDLAFTTTPTATVPDRLTSGTVTNLAQSGLGFAMLVLEIDATRVAYTDISMTCTHSRDGGTNVFTIQTCDTSTTLGTCTSLDAAWLKTTSVSVKYTWRVGILGLRQVACTFAATAAGAGDDVTVTGYIITQ